MAISNKFVNDVQLAAKVDKADGCGLISDSDKEQIAENKNNISALDQLLPATAPTATEKYLRVLAINDDGTFTCEWADTPSGGGTVSDVQINKYSILDTSTGVANIQIDTNGLQNLNGKLYISQLSTEYVDKRSSASLQMDRRALMMNRVDYAVKAAMCDGKGTAWIATEQTAAQKRMGIVTLTQEEYDLLETKGESTFYVIVEDDDTDTESES